MSAGELTGAEIPTLLHELTRRLVARGTNGYIKLLG
ncbi:hypothetical protein QO003_000218 [Arthrobacter silviterrae]|nr:hypothetical protein [Arthrobacter silviterrae]